MESRGYELQEKRLREAILERDIDEVQLLLKNNVFRMPGEEMDELLKQLGTQSIKTLENRMSRERNVVYVLSKEAQLKIASESNDPAHIRLILEKLKCGSQLKASSIASVAMHGIRANLQPNYDMIELLLQCACDVKPRLWDSKVALPILYGVLSELPARLTKKLLQLPEAKSRSIPVALLHLAVKSGNIPVVEEIICDPDLYNIRVDDIYAGDSHRATALMRASHHGHVDMVAYLIRCGADMRKRDRNKRTALHHASAQGHDNVVRLLLLQRQNTITVANSGVVEEVRSSMEYVDGVDEWGMSALHLAVCGGHAEVVKSLVDAGADPSLRAPHHSSQSQSKFTFFLDTYLTACRKQVIDYEDLYMQTSNTKTATSKEVEDGNLEVLLPRNDCFRLSPVMSVYWHPGGFTALHFAVAYARTNIDAVFQSLLPVVSEKLRRMKDSNGLTALDWAVGMQQQLLNVDDEGRQLGGGGDGKEMTLMGMGDLDIIHILEFEGCSGAANVIVDDSMSLRYTVARRYKQVLERMEERKKEMEWGDMMGSALRNGEFVVAEALANKECRKWIRRQSLGGGTIEHLRWAASEPCAAIREQWKWDYETRRFVVPVKGWGRRVEKVMVELMMSAAEAIKDETAPAVIMEGAELQKLLVWAMRNGMADLGKMVCRMKECELLLPLRSSWDPESIAPMSVLRALQTSSVAQEILPVVHAMKARRDIRESESQQRALQMNFLNTLLVASALIGGLAFSAILQPPSSFKNVLDNANSWSRCATSNTYGRWRIPAAHHPTSILRDGQKTTSLLRSRPAAAASTTTTSITPTTTMATRPLNHTLPNRFIVSASLSFLFSLFAMVAGIYWASATIGRWTWHVFCFQRLTLASLWLALLAILMAFFAVTEGTANKIYDRTERSLIVIFFLGLGFLVLHMIGIWTMIWIWNRVIMIELHMKRRTTARTSTKDVGHENGIWRSTLVFFILVAFMECVLDPILRLLKVPLSRRYIIRKRCLEAALKTMFCARLSSEDVDLVVPILLNIPQDSSSPPPLSLFS